MAPFVNPAEIGKRARANRAVNRVVRDVLSVTLRGAGHADRLARRWSISGVVPITLHGARFLMLGRADDPVLDALYYRRDWEVPETTLFASLVRDAEVVFDIGANTGVYSLMSTQLSDTVAVIAAEPSPANAARLRANLTLNAITRVTVVEAALGATEGTLELTVPADGSISDTASAFGTFSRAHDERRHATVPVAQTTIDGLVARNGCARVDIIKLDVEYFEVEVLKGATRTLAELAPVVLAEVLDHDVLVGLTPELEDRIPSTNSHDVQALMLSFGYAFFAIGRRGILRVTNLGASLDGGSNYLFVKNPVGPRFIPYSDTRALRALLQPASPRVARTGSVG
jgi:FkbM family methyltransferase